MHKQALSNLQLHRIMANLIFEEQWFPFHFYRIMRDQPLKLHNSMIHSQKNHKKRKMNKWKNHLTFIMEIKVRMSETLKMGGKAFTTAGWHLQCYSANALLNDRQTEMYANREDEELKDQY